MASNTPALGHDFGNFHGSLSESRRRKTSPSFRLQRLDVPVQILDPQMHFGAVSLSHLAEQATPDGHFFRTMCRQVQITLDRRF